MIAAQQSSIDRHIARRIVLAREQTGMTQEELAAAAEFSVPQLRRYEAGGRVPISDLFAIAMILERPIDFFYEGLARKD